MRVLLFGTGEYYQKYKIWFDDDEVLALVDNSKDKQGSYIDNKKVIAPEQINEYQFDYIFALSVFYLEIQGQLVSLGIDKSKICSFNEIYDHIEFENRKIENVIDIAHEKDVLLLNTNLALGGPALALFSVALTLKSIGRKVTYGAMTDGPLKSLLMENNIPVIVDSNLLIETMDDNEWVKNYSLIICNTIDYHVFLSNRDTNIPVIWWLHDSMFYYDTVNIEAINRISSKNLSVFAVGRIAKNSINYFRPDLETNNLLYGVIPYKDFCYQEKERPNNIINFVVIGLIEPRKGQDILINAIEKLEDSIRSKCRFSLVGKDSSLYACELKKRCAGIKEVEFLGIVDRKGINDILENADMLICPSRQDCMPTVCAEAMMHQVPCLVSDSIGTSSYISEENGIIFENENCEMLAEKISWVVNNPERIVDMGKNARKVYEEFFSIEVLNNNVKKIMNNMIDSDLNIVLYGLSTETQKVIKDWNSSNTILGLLDGFKTSGEQFGYPILDINDVVLMDNVAIIVVARPGSCKAIAKRIGNICKNHDIPVFDIRGKNLLEDNKVVYDFKSVKGYTRKDMIEAIEAVDVVSFDLFDTLVVRDSIEVTDVVEILASKLSEEGRNLVPDFVARRIEAEKVLSYNGSAPGLKDIYLSFCDDVKIAEELALKEFEVELGILEPRTDMIEIISIAQDLGKKVFITSDTYYSYDQISKILEKNRISGIDGLILSCEKGTSKSGELYEILKKAAGSSKILKKETGNLKILHIGDDIVSDIEKAGQHDISTFRIYSASELLDLLGGLELAQHTNALSDRIKVGMFAAKLFNSPFQFEDSDKNIFINKSDEIGYLLCAPMIMDFSFWFKDIVSDEKYVDVLFGARDGYLIKKVYELIGADKSNRYFLTSRVSAIRAGMETEEDIYYVDEMKYSGSMADNLMERFGIEAERIAPEDINNNKAGLMAYSKSILENATVIRENNKKYISSSGIQNGEVVFFDFVAKGTSQLYLQRLIPNHICGAYFLQLEPDSMRDKDIEIKSFYTEEERADSAIFENYYILETILTSPDPSLLEFDSKGNPVYAKETRPKADIDCVLNIHDGVLKYIERFLYICPESERSINKKLDEGFLKLVQNVKIGDDDFLSLVVEDPFFNRTTDIKDLI